MTRAQLPQDETDLDPTDRDILNSVDWSKGKMELVDVRDSLLRSINASSANGITLEEFKPAWTSIYVGYHRQCHPAKKQKANEKAKVDSRRRHYAKKLKEVFLQH